MVITGTTRLVAVIADPVAPLASPQVHNPILERETVNAIVVPLHVAAADLPIVWAGLRRTANVAGVGVALPHKIAAAALCDELSDTARFVGAVNIVRRNGDGTMSGANFDGDGFVGGLRHAGRDPSGWSVLMLGAGGAASAVAFALAGAGIRSLTLVNRSRARADALLGKLSLHWPMLLATIAEHVDAVRGTYDLVVNATSVGMTTSDPPPIPLASLGGSPVIADLVLGSETALVRDASRRGLTVQPSDAMLDSQLALRLAFLDLVPLRSPSHAL
jgi:shikimate dehydrogenase